MIKELVRFMESAQRAFQTNIINLSDTNMNKFNAPDILRDLKDKKRYNGATITNVHSIGVADLSFKQIKQINPDFECTCGILNVEHEKRAPRMIMCDDWAYDEDDDYVGDGPATHSHLPNGFGYDVINEPNYYDGECDSEGECDGCLATVESYEALDESDLFDCLDDMSFYDEQYVHKSGILRNYAHGERSSRTLCKCNDNPNYLPLSERVKLLTELGYDPMTMFVLGLSNYFMSTSASTLHKKYIDDVGIEWENDLTPYGYYSLYLVDYLKYFKELTNEWVSPNPYFTRTLNYIPQSNKEFKGTLVNKLVEMRDVLRNRGRNEKLMQFGGVFKVIGITKGWRDYESLHLMNFNNPSYMITVAVYESDDGKIRNYDDDIVVNIIPSKRKVVCL